MSPVKSVSASRFVLLLALAMPLAGCAIDDLTGAEKLEPFGGSKQHPIKVTGNKAWVEPCGQWPENVANTQSNALMPNHGCAVQANIAAMAAYPKDLVQPRQRSLPPAFTRMKAVKALSGQQ
jgi:type IV pilus biogenesis protein CpaD/CtpE